MVYYLKMKKIIILLLFILFGSFNIFAVNEINQNLGESEGMTEFIGDREFYIDLETGLRYEILTSEEANTIYEESIVKNEVEISQVSNQTNEENKLDLKLVYYLLALNFILLIIVFIVLLNKKN